MYRLKGEENFIILTGDDIIDLEEGKAICRKLSELIEVSPQNDKVLLDFRKVNLEDSDFDIFINYISKVKISKIALILSDLISKLKFRLWKRRYNNYIDIEQFITVDEGRRWLLGK